MFMGEEGVTVIASEAASLGVGLRGALEIRGWAPARLRPVSALAAVRGETLVLVVEDDSGAVAQAVAVREPVACVCVGSIRSLALMIPFAERGAHVLNAAAPFVVLVGLVDAALRQLRSGPMPMPKPRPASSLRRRVDEGSALARLSPAERETLQALMAGAGAAEVAERSYRSLHSVRSHIKAVLSKLDVSSQLAAVAVAERSGWYPTVAADRATFEDWTPPWGPGARP